MKTTRSSRSESRYSLPVCGAVTPALTLGDDPDLAAVPLPGLTATLMALPWFGLVVRLSNSRPVIDLLNDNRASPERQDGPRDAGWGRPGIPLAGRSDDRRGDLFGDRAQARKKALAHFVARRARGMRTQIERRKCLATAVQDRHRDRPQTALELFVDD